MINVLRAYEKIWMVSIDHPICMEAKSTEGLRCMFCSFRSFSLRENSEKRKKALKPVGIISHMEQLPLEENFLNRFSEFFQETLKAICKHEPEFSSLIFGKQETCMNCLKAVSFQDSYVLRLQAFDGESLKDTNLQEAVDFWNRKVKVQHKEATGCKH